MRVLQRRDALRKMFEASGKTVAAFSDMYGMDPDEVARMLERSRVAQAAQSVAAEAEASVQEATPPAPPAAEPIPANTPEAR